MNEATKADLASSDPAAGDNDARLRHLVQRLAVDVETASTTPAPSRAHWWKRARVMVPIGVATLAVLTGAAAVVLPLDLSVNGTTVALDAEIPIEYTTNTGVFVSCRYGIYFGDPANRTAADEELADFVENHDWTGIGQRIYDEAVANPFVPGPGDDIENDTQEVRDGFSWAYATHLISDEIPEDLREAGLSSGGASDCTGQLR